MKKYLSKLFKLIVVAVIVVCVWQAIDPNSYIKCLITKQRIATIIVGEIQKRAVLETATLDLERIAKNGTNRPQWWGIQDENITYDIYGQVIAGIDLSDFQITDVLVENPTTITISLHKAKILHVVIDNQNSKVIYHTKGLLAQSDINLESNTLAQAETDLINAAISRNILNVADINAHRFMESLFSSVGVKTFSFVAK